MANRQQNMKCHKRVLKRHRKNTITYHWMMEDASFFLCKELVPGYLDGITGEYSTPEGYLVDEREAEEFDIQLMVYSVRV